MELKNLKRWNLLTAVENKATHNFDGVLEVFLYLENKKKESTLAGAFPEFTSYMSGWSCGYSYYLLAWAGLIRWPFKKVTTNASVNPCLITWSR